MKVIFLKDVPRVGKKYDVKEISDGYAVNFLFPRKLAEPATPQAVAKLELHKKEIVIEKEVQDNLLQKNLEEIKGKILVIKVKTDDKGHLFKAISEKMIAEEMHLQHHVEIKPEFIILETPLKEIGGFEIPIEIKNKKSSLRLLIEKI